MLVRLSRYLGTRLHPQLLATGQRLIRLRIQRLLNMAHIKCRCFSQKTPNRMIHRPKNLQSTRKLFRRRHGRGVRRERQAGLVPLVRRLQRQNLFLTLATHNPTRRKRTPIAKTLNLKFKRYRWVATTHEIRVERMRKTPLIHRRSGSHQRLRHNLATINTPHLRQRMTNKTIVTRLLQSQNP